MCFMGELLFGAVITEIYFNEKIDVNTVNNIKNKIDKDKLKQYLK